MNKRILAFGMAAVLTAAAVTGCGSAKHATKSSKTDSEVPEVELSEKYAFLLPDSDDPYDDKVAEGFQQIMETAGKEYELIRVSKNPVEEQKTYVEQLIEEKVACIAVNPADADELSDVLKQAMEAGIDVCAVETPTDPECRELFINPAGTQQIAVTMMDAVLDISGGSGEWAVLSSQSTAVTENTWIDAMRETMKDDKYADLEMVEIAYGDEQYQRTYDQTKSLLQNYPDLKVILVPTTTAIKAVCEAVKDSDSTVKVTGFGLPSEMTEYTGSNNICPYFYLWNPLDLGELTAYVSIALHQGVITGELGEKFKAGDMGEFEVTEAQDKGTEVIVGYPYRFDSSNIDEWSEIF